MSRPEVPNAKDRPRPGQPAAAPPAPVLPPAPPGESPPGEIEKTRAVAEALARLGEGADPREVAEHARAIQGAIVSDTAKPPFLREAGREPDATRREETRPTPASRSARQVREVMTREVECVGPDATLQEAAARMKALGVGPLPVCDKGRLAGMVTDRDITVRANADDRGAFPFRVRDIMTPEVVSCFEDQGVEEAARLMEEKQIRRLLVLDRDQRLVGIVSLDDLAAKAGDPQLAGEALGRVSEPATPRH
jgi:CBS domain-containing protein